MIKEFNKLEEIEKYYCKETNTYVFKEDGKWIDLVIFNFDLYVKANINACAIKARDIDVYDIDASDISASDIDACNINANNIDARDIKAGDISTDNFTARVINVHNIVAGIINVININAYDIDATAIMAGNIKAHNIKYFTVCFAEKDIICNSIKGKREGTKHFVFDGKLEVKNNGNSGNKTR